MPETTPNPLAHLLREVRIRASLLMKRAHACEPAAVARLGPTPKRRRALDLTAQEMTASDYRSLGARCKTASGTIADPTLIFERRVSAFWNHWFADAQSARAHLKAHGGALFPYRSQFVVVQPGLLAAVALDPQDPDWDRIGHDWSEPRDADAFARLNAKLIIAGFSREVHHAS
ncbi:MAG: hypothetical protein AAFN79_05695 [Pseudomonadota bacterium]